MIVLDASVLLEVLFDTPVADSLTSRIRGDRVELAVPHLADLEVAQVLRRWVRARVFSAERSVMALEDLVKLPIRRYPHLDLLPRIWQLRENLSAYDASYVALAEVLDAVLITRDEKLFKNRNLYRAEVEFV